MKIFLLSAGLFLTALSFAAPARIPVVLDTDIGSDVDDTWALAQVLRTPELDLKLVLTDTGEARYRAAIAAKLLEQAGRTDVAVGLGLDAGPMADADRHQGPWIKGYNLDRYPGRVHADGVNALIELVRASPVPVTIIAVGPTPTLAEALRRAPDLAARCRLVGMHGSFDLGYGGAAPPVAEANVKGAPAALRTVLSAPWQDILLTPLDTCGTVEIAGSDYAAIWAAAPSDALLRAVIENYCIWAPRVPWIHCDFFATRSSTLFDCVAVSLAHSEAYMEIESVKFRVTDYGFTVRDPAGPHQARVALRWTDRAAYVRLLVRTLLTPTAPRP